MNFQSNFHQAQPHLSIWSRPACPSWGSVHGDLANFSQWSFSARRYRSRFQHVRTRFAAFFKLHIICVLLHRFELNISGFLKLFLSKDCNNFQPFRKDLPILTHFIKFVVFWTDSDDFFSECLEMCSDFNSEKTPIAKSTASRREHPWQPIPLLLL